MLKLLQRVLAVFGHFKHYLHRERRENPISNFNIEVLMYNRMYSVLHDKVRANMRHEKIKFL